MPLYLYDPGEYEDLRSYHESYEEYRTRSGGEREPFPEAEYALDATGNRVKYVPASATFDAGDLDGHARVAYDELLALGASVAVGSYDGGGDEIFTRLDRITVGEVDWDREKARVELAGGPVGDNPASYDRYWVHNHDYFERMDRAERAGYGLDALAGELRARLGVSGTGEFSVQGTFRANLRDGTVVDVSQEA